MPLALRRSRGPRATRWAGTLTRSILLPLFLLALAPFLANWQAVSGWLQGDPIYLTSALAVDVAPGPLAGFTSQDPNDGWTTEALGRLAAEQWLSGRVPWWNPYGGPGLPLAAEMQCSALFLPFVLLLHFAQGPLLLKLVMQLVAGLATYALLRAVGLGHLAAATGGALYALNGTFAWFGHAPMLPVAFLPLLLLGIERAWRAAQEGRGGGWAWVGAALAWSLYAGFPETAYIDGLLALAWAGLRFGQASGRARAAFAAKIAIGGVAGLLLAAPLLLPFAQLLRDGDVGGRGHDFSALFVPPEGLALLLAPYLAGPRNLSALFEASDPYAWIPGRLGGYLSLPWLLLALVGAVGLVGRRDRGLRWLLLAWCALALGRTAGLPGVAQIVNAIPLLPATMFFRYAAPSWEMAAALLAAFALDGWWRGRVGALAVPLAAVSVIALIGAALLTARPLLAVVLARAPDTVWWLWGSLMWGGGAAVAAALLLLGSPSGWRLTALAVLVGLDALLVFTVPGFSAPRRATLDRDALTFLARNLGLQRFHTLGPLLPNYGAYFRLASADAFVLPAPQSWSDYVIAALDPYAVPISFGGPRGPFGPSANAPSVEAVLLDRLASYEELSVRYVLAPHGADPFAETVSSGAEPLSGARPLIPGEEIADSVPAGWPKPGDLARVGVLVFTYKGAANGRLAIELCSARACAHSTIELADAPDGGVADAALDAPLAVAPGDVLRYRLRHVGGNQAVALGMVRPVPSGGTPGGADLVPRLALSYVRPAAAPARAFADALVDIYELPHPKPYWEVRDGLCTLARAGREAVEADCGAPALLVRRELAYPGWRATVNGAAVPVDAVAPLFQAVRLPQGRSEVRFHYTPPGIPWAWAAALLGAATLAGSAVGRMRGKDQILQRK